MNNPDLLAAALDFTNHGYSVAPTRADGTKAPIGKWGRYKTERPDTDMVTAWFTRGAYDGFGVICGAISGNLEMLELEGRAVDEGIHAQLEDIADASGLGDLWRYVTDGYSETTPTGGLHILYRVTEPVAGNTKLARRAATPAELENNPRDKLKVLIETRGEGGYVVVAPSAGRTHPSGHAWTLTNGGPDTIATVTPDQRDALHALARALDATPAPETAPEPPPSRTGTHTGRGSDGPGVADDYNNRTAWNELLIPNGWAHVYTAGRVSYWRRPGKAVGISATTGRNDGDNLYVFSTSTDFDAERPYSRFAAYAQLHHGGDYSAAAKALYREGYGARPEPRPAAAAPPPPAEPPNDDDAPPDDGEEPNEQWRPGMLPDEFWTARPSLEHIRRASWSRGRSAEAVLSVALARLAADTTHVIKIPAMVGAICGLSIIVAPIGLPGQGKSSGEDIAREVLPARRLEPVCDGIAPGSRQGLAELLFDEVDEPDPNNPKKTVKAKRQTRYNAFITVDEGETLLASQRGRVDPNNVSPDLKTIFSDRTWGQANASAEKKRVVTGGSYVYGVVVILQPEKAGPLFTETGSGLPQRFLFSSASAPVPPPGERPEWPGPLPRPKPGEVKTDAYGRIELDFDPDIAKQVQWDDYEKHQKGGDPLDVHRNLIRLKVAALLALMDSERHNVTTDDWHLAGMILDASDQVRRSVLASLESMKVKERDDRRRAQTEDAIATDEAVRRNRTERGARWLARKVHDADIGHWTVATLRRAGSKAVRDVFDDALEHAKRERWVTETAETTQGTDRRSINPGRVKP